MTEPVLYCSGLTAAPHNIPITGGLWRMHRQEGFPIDISLLECRERGHLPDWLDAMAEASMYDELPQLEELSGGIPEEAKIAFAGLMNLRRKTCPDYREACRQIVDEKRNNKYQP